MKSKFSKELVKRYGEQTYRDKRAQGRKGKSAYEDAAWSSVYVASACGEIEEKDQRKFLKVIVNYAKTTKFPKNFI
jgi:hypothetical protein